MSRAVSDLFDRLAAEEQRFLGCDFVAPHRVARSTSGVAGVVWRLRVGGFRGWGVFRPTGSATSRLLRPATPNSAAATSTRCRSAG